ncbi:MAG TPA: SH3 domain-containing protein [Thermoanaerobaculia bacterium]|nr:SH3 domain-containing protein [Thermoanaerobaculia bacterium]
MKYIAAALLLFVACKAETPVPALDTRAPIETLYVAGPQAEVRAKAQDGAPVISTYQNGEALAVLSKQGDWLEVRAGDGSGWVRASDLGTAQEKTAEEANPTPKFRVMPLPVSAPGAHGEVYFEADVNTDGEVVNVKTLSNTTGSEGLAGQNANALRAAKFQPIVIKGERKPFKYYHKVSY